VRVYLVLSQDGSGEGVSRESWEQLLDAENPHKLMYSLQIVESLSRPPKLGRTSYDVRFSTSRILFIILLTFFFFPCLDLSGALYAFCRPVFN